MTIRHAKPVWILAGVSLLALLGLPPNSTAAQPCRPGDVSASCRHAKGLLWKIERSSAAPSFLFGTIHIADPRVTNLPTPVRDALNNARSFSMELIFDGAGIVHMAETMFFNDGRTLESVLGAQRYAELRRVLNERKVPLSDLNRKKPWVVAMAIAAPEHPGIALDMQLQISATLQNKPTLGLETMQEQLTVFNGLSMEDQVALLDHALRSHREADKLLETMVRAYLARDLAEIMAIMNSAGASDQRLQDTLMSRLLTQRNVRMIDRMRPRLEEGNAFIAVGAAHLPGNDGLLALLERAGWRVTPVY
jgi:uncharacterized protein YbaP (TraB family)